MGGGIKSGFGDLGRGMSSALVGSGYGWDGCVVCLWWGLFSWGVWFGGCGVCVFVWRVMSDSGEWVVGLVCGLGWGKWGKKKLITLWLLLKLRISGGSEFCFKNLC